MTQQKEADQLKNLMSSEFVRRNDVSFSYAQTIALVKALPGFRSAWFASDYDLNGDMRNQNGVDNPIAAVGTPLFGMGSYCPQVALSGADFFVGVSGNSESITGVESHVSPLSHGFTLAVSLNISVLASASNQYIAGKWGATTDYLLYVTNTGFLQILFRDTINGLQGHVAPLSATGWQTIIVQWDKSNNETHFFVNDHYSKKSQPLLNQITLTSQPFTIGAHSGSTNFFIGDISFIALYDQYHPMHKALRESSMGGWPFLT